MSTAWKGKREVKKGREVEAEAEVEEEVGIKGMKFALVGAQETKIA